MVVAVVIVIVVIIVITGRSDSLSVLLFSRARPGHRRRRGCTPCVSQLGPLLRKWLLLLLLLLLMMKRVCVKS